MATKAVNLEGDGISTNSFKVSQKQDIFSRLSDAARNIESGLKQIETGLKPAAQNGDSGTGTPGADRGRSGNIVIKKNTLIWMAIGAGLVFFATASSRRNR